MAKFLAKYDKNVLLQLAIDLGVEIIESNSIREIIKLIVEASDYDEEFTKDRLEFIFEKQEKQRLDIEQEKQRLDIEKEKEKERQFELEKLRIQSTGETVSVDSNMSFSELHRMPKINLKDLVPKFDPKSIDITLFLMIFERQTERAEIRPNDLVSQLIPLLPLDIAEIIVKEPPEVNNDYNYIKKILLKRFKLGSGALRAKFEGHQRKHGALWTDLVYELRGYLNNWLDSVGVDNFESLKELMITEQLKRRIPFDMRDKYIDEWDEFKLPSILADKCDRYESVRANFRRSERKNWDRKPFQDNVRGNTNVKTNNEFKVKQERFEKKDFSKNQGKNDLGFEKKRQIICYLCNQPGHYKNECKELKKRTDLINHIGMNNELGECFKPYLKRAKINGIERNYLRDTGSSVDLCNRSWINNEDFTGEITWIKQPLDQECKCLPLAWIEIQSDFGIIRTKAAIKPIEAEQGYYLLGNKTAELINRKEKAIPVNLVITRSKNKKETEISRNKDIDQVKTTNENFENSQGETQKVFDHSNDQSVGRVTHATSKDAEISPLPIIELKGGSESQSVLQNISAGEFSQEQDKCLTLKSLWEKAKNETNSEFRVKEGKLVRLSKSKNGDCKEQLVLPLEYRKGIMELCHDEISGHLGTTKTKDRILNCFYWPNCFKEIEDFVRSCHPCQMVGKHQDKKKAPLKLVPIISEVFSKINFDAVGPLTLSDKGNRYMITSICLASKYPDAIPVSNLSSVSVINALLQIFSRTGFPREVQCDLGSSFTSELTTEFFNKFGIKVIHSSVAHPQTNVVERTHLTLKRVLKTLCLEAKKDWEEVLPMALFSLRTVIHESIGYSPAELVNGKNLRMPHTLIYENWLGKESENQNVVDYILNLINRLKRCQELSAKQMKECQIKRKYWYDRNAVLRKFHVGDKVLVLATSKTNKMAVNWMGPGTITSVISETNYTVDLPEKRGNPTIYHVNLIKPYYCRPECINFIMEMEKDEIEIDAEIPYLTADANQLDFWELVRDSELEKRVNTDQIDSLKKIIEKHKRTFSTDPGLTQLIEMDIVLTDDVPIRSKPYRMSPRQTEILREEINRLLALGVIEVGRSNYTSPMILVESPGKNPRPCVDYRKLNAKTRIEYFPLPNIEEVVERVSAAKFITVMDLTKGYFQIPLTKRAQQYAAFVTPFGAFIPKVMMFGLINSAFQFCNLMSRVLEGCENFAIPYIDDIAIFSGSWEQHLKDIDVVLKRLGEANLTVKPSKSLFAQKHVKFLGHEIGSGKRSPSEIKIQAIKDFPMPTNKTQLRAFLGTVGYYSRYIKDYATVAVPLTNALKGKIKKEKIIWSKECQDAFENLKEKLMQNPVLYAPDFKAQFIVQTDASLYGAGIVLSQIHQGEEHPILYLSKKFSKAEKNYSTIERELAAIIYGLKKLKHYLDGQSFVIQTDHNPLTFLNKMMDHNSRLTRWALCLQQYNCKIEHKPGKLHGNVDGLSRKE